ncbi:MAG: 3-carboxy-cis,cis-muconate cycloisomerase [Syntrophaceae bacterium PtaU1.Bin231]|nr:MAG: 3-carboxy-cis,cis-muconate cycloisomerase [Syntrophaceae bacterium PtaU1.Bin231]
MKKGRRSVAHCAVVFLAAVVLVFVSSVHSFAAQSPSMKELFGKSHSNQILLDIEAALARAQAKTGIIPQAAADEINRKADVKYLPAEELANEYKKVGHPMVAIINVWARYMDGNAGEFIHYGATTQDIYDTSYVIQLRAAARLLLSDMRDIEMAMIDLARGHRDTPMMGRTLGQHALPITFGMKVGVWIAENRRNMERLKDSMKRLNSGLLKGAVGSYAGLGEKGFEVEELLMKELGLAPPDPADWHGVKDNFAEFANVLAVLGMTYGKIGQEIFLLQSTDLGEVEEKLPSTAVGSSTMPHKRNPVKSKTLVVLAREIRRHAEVIMDWMVSIHERDQITSADQLAEICIKTDRLLKAAKPLLKDLIVYPEAMMENIHKTKGLIMSEKLMLVLGEKIGKHTAHETVRDVSMEAYRKKMTLKDAILARPDLAKHLKKEELDEIFDPVKYIGLAPQEVDRVIAATMKYRETDRF